MWAVETLTIDENLFDENLFEAGNQLLNLNYNNVLL